MNLSTSLKKIDVIILDLEHTALQLDTNNDKLKAHKLLQDSAMFSSDLFRTSSDLFIDYIDEIKINAKQLKRLITANNTSLIEYRIESIERQISSLLNAFNSNKGMHNEAQNRLNAHKARRFKKSAKNLVQPSQNLYQTLAEHHEFERRLIQMLTDKEAERNVAPARKLDKLSQKVLVLHQRLGRCRQAISKIENDIVNLEKRSIFKK